MRHNPAAPEDDPFPQANGWFSRPGRPIAEIKEVQSVSGNTVTFTTPLHISYRTARAAQLTRYTGASVHVRGAGVEDLSVEGGSDGAIRFESAAYSWARNIGNTTWLGDAVAINDSFRVEVRDSYIHDTAWPEPGGGGYAISFSTGSAEALIENNIVLQANKVMVARAAGAGSVVGYNYMDDGHIGYDPVWVEVGINGSHMVGSHHILFEGNESFNYDSDCTHGNAIYHTVFRNHLSGFRRSFSGLGNARAAGLEYGSWWHSFVGNVLGTPGITGGASSQVTLRSNNGLFISDNISLGGGGHVGTEYIGIGVTNGGGTQLQSDDHPWNNNLTPTSLVQAASGSTVILDRKDLNDPPLGSAAPHTIAKNTIANAPPANASSYLFLSTDFGFSDPIDAPPGNTPLNVIITGLPSNGTLTFNDTTAIASTPGSVDDTP
jgi:hypothetical protein